MVGRVSGRVDHFHARFQEFIVASGGTSVTVLCIGKIDEISIPFISHSCVSTMSFLLFMPNVVKVYIDLMLGNDVWSVHGWKSADV